MGDVYPFVKRYRLIQFFPIGYMMLNFSKNRSRMTAIALFAAVLAGCGGGSDDSGSFNSGGGGGSGSGGSGSGSGGSSSNCNYTDLLASTRAQANGCGIQASSLYLSADSLLQQAVLACQRGSKAEADAYYEGTYRRAAQNAIAVAQAEGCTAGGGTATPPTSTKPGYNACARLVNGGQQVSYLCHGPVENGSGTCPSGFSFLKQFSSSSACSAAVRNEAIAWAKR